MARYRLGRRPMRGRAPRRFPYTSSLISRSAKMAAAANLKVTATVAHAAAVKMAGAANMTATATVTRLAIVQFTADELLDLIVTPRRVESFRFDVVDQDGNTLGELAVTNESVPRISNDASRRIRRDLSGVVIPPRTALTSDQTNRYFAEDIETQTHRIKVWHVLGSGGPDYELPLGLFVFSNDPRRIRSYGDAIEASLDDLSQIFDQRVVESRTWPAGTNIATALRDLYDDAGLECEVDATGATLGEPVTMLALQDSRQSTAERFCALAGFLPPYFSNDGIGICRATPDYAASTPDLAYGSGSRAFDGTLIETSALLLAPNVWVAEARSATDGAIVGRYELPAEDPHSFQSIGHWIPEPVDVQGIGDQTAADEAARAAGVASRKQLRRRQWSSPIDSRHDTFDAIAWDDEVDLEQSWAMDLVPGGTMAHEAVVLS